MNNIGLQLWSIREEMTEDLLGMLEKVSKMGYAGVQFAGFGGHSAEEVKRKLDEVGLVAAGAHVQIDELKNNLEETLEYHKVIGNDLIIVPYLEENMRTTEDDYKQTASLLNDIGKKLVAKGFTFGYHNHDFEFDMFNGKTGLDIIFENTNEAYLKMELDCFWASYTNNDPLRVIDKYADRCVSLHIKDLKMEEGTPISTELGTGTLPLKTYMQKGKDVGVRWHIVEQEHFAKDPLEIARENAQYINKTVEKLD